MPPPPLVKPSGGDVNQGPSFLAVLWATTAVAFLFVVARIFVRVKVIKYQGWDDYLIILSIVLGLVGVVIDTVAVAHGLGRHEFYLTLDQIQQATKYNFLAIPWNLMSSAAAKVSVCFFLLHVNRSKTASWVLYTFSVVLTLFATATIAVLFGQCNPPEALWTLSLRQDHCLPAGINAAVGLAQSIFFAIADALFALFPLTFLWKLKITRRTKLALGFVLGLGFLAAAFGAVRCADLQEIGSRADVLFSTVDLGIWSFLEANITIIAACIPPLYAVFRTALGNKSSAAPTYLPHSNRNESKTGGGRAVVQPYNSSGGPRSKIRSNARRGSANEGFEFAGMPPQSKHVPIVTKRPTAAEAALAWEDSTTGGSSHHGSATITRWDSLGKDDGDGRHGLAVSDPRARAGSEDSEEDILPKQKPPGRRRPGERSQGGSFGQDGQHQAANDNIILRSTEVIITREDRADGEREEARDVF